MRTLREKKAEEEAELAKLIPHDIDLSRSEGSVLLSDQIQFLSEEHSLISDFNPDHLKPAGYELTVGSEYYLGGEHHSFDDPGHSAVLRIPSFEVAVIKTAERICLPRYLIARWNLRVRYAYEGLLWVGAAQVDPGYKGFLFCPIYNLSHKPVEIPRGEPIALIDFVRTTKYISGASKDYGGNTRPIIEDFNPERLRSALFDKVGKKLEEFSEATHRIENRFGVFVTITFAALAILIALSVNLIQQGLRVELGISLWSNAILFVSLLALLLSLLVLFSHRINTTIVDRFSALVGRHSLFVQRIMKRNFWLGALVSVGITVGGIYFLYSASQEHIADFSEKASEIAGLRADMRQLRGDVIELLKEKQSPAERRISETLGEIERRFQSLEARIDLVEEGMGTLDSNGAEKTD